MDVRALFEDMVDELAAHPEVALLEASVGAAPPSSLAAVARRRLRFANPLVRDQVAGLPPLALRWTLKHPPNADGEVPPAVAGLALPGGEELVERLVEASARSAADGRPRFVSLDRWPRYATGMVVGQGVVGPRLALRDGGGLLTMPPMLPFDYLGRVFAHRGLYVLRTLEAGDPALLGPLAPTQWRADKRLLSELVALAGLALELPDPDEASGLSGARVPRRARCS